MKKFLTFALMSFAATTAYASSSISLNYENNKFIQEELANVEVAHQVGGFEVGANLSFDDKNVHSYGATVGVPLNTFNTDFVVTPFLGVDRYHKLKEYVGNVGVGLSLPLTQTVSLGAKAKLAFPIDKDVDLDHEGVYQVGLTKRF